MDDILEDEGVAWPSYVDFLFSFCFILVLALGYMAFLSVHGVEGQAFQKEATAGKAALEQLGLSPSIDWNERRVSIPLPFIAFDVGCPRKLSCPDQLPQDQQVRLRELARLLSSQFAASKAILLRGQADRTKGSDDFVNFRIASDRAVSVYGVLLRCPDCGFVKSNGSLTKVQLDNVGDTRAAAEGDGKQDRTVTIILDYSQ